MKESRVNVLSCSFVCAAIVPFGIALNYAHLNAADYRDRHSPPGVPKMDLYENNGSLVNIYNPTPNSRGCVVS